MIPIHVRPSNITPNDVWGSQTVYIHILLMCDLKKEAFAHVRLIDKQIFWLKAEESLSAILDDARDWPANSVFFMLLLFALAD